jgi:hypothetical protein
MDVQPQIYSFLPKPVAGPVLVTIRGSAAFPNGAHSNET